MPHHESVLELEGGYSAFAAEVGVADDVKKHQYHVPGLRVVFEIYVDGKLVCQSGLMGDSDAPRLLAAGNLAPAKELKLVTRMEALGDSPFNDSHPGYAGYVCLWADARFISK